MSWMARRMAGWWAGADGDYEPDVGWELDGGQKLDSKQELDKKLGVR